MPINFKRVDHFHVCVPPEKLQEARDFYTDVIGLTRIYRPDHLFSSAGAWYDIGDVQLHIGVEPPLPWTIRHVAVEVEDIAEARAHLSANNVQIIEEPVIPGRTRFAFLDPFGNRMELLQMDNDLA